MTTAIYDDLAAETGTRLERITEAVYSGRSDLGDTQPIGIAVTPILLKRRPAVVEAVQVTETNVYAAALWCDGKAVWALNDDLGVEMLLDTGHYAVAYVGDWIIRGQLGQFYPAPDDAIWAGYDRLVALVSE